MPGRKTTIRYLNVSSDAAPQTWEALFDEPSGYTAQLIKLALGAGRRVWLVSAFGIDADNDFILADAFAVSSVGGQTIPLVADYTTAYWSDGAQTALVVLPITALRVQIPTGSTGLLVPPLGGPLNIVAILGFEIEEEAP